MADVDLNKMHLTVRRALQVRPGGALELVEPKSARSRRSISLPTTVADALIQQHDQQATARTKAGDDWNEQGFVFTTRTGGPIHPRNDYRSFQLLLTKAGLRRERLHDLRHTAASLLLEQGVHPRVVMEILGHSQISLTMNTYSHVVPGSVRAATDIVQEALWNTD